MDLASIIGLVVGIILIVFGIVYGDNGVDFSVINNFINVPSIIITFGGTFTSVLTSYTLKDYINSLKGYGKIFSAPKLDVTGMITNIIGLSNVARKEGLLALEEAANEIDDEFLKKGILLIVDGTDPELVRAILETEMLSVEGRHKKVIGGYCCHGSCMGYDWYPYWSGKHVKESGRCFYYRTINGGCVAYNFIWFHDC